MMLVGGLRAEYGNNTRPHEWLRPIKIKERVTECNRGCNVVDSVGLKHQFEPRRMTPVWQQSHNFTATLSPVDIKKLLKDRGNAVTPNAPSNIRDRK